MDNATKNMLNKAIADCKPLIDKIVLDEIKRHTPPYMPRDYTPIYTEFVEDAES